MRLYMNTALIRLHRRFHIVMQSDVRAFVGGIRRHQFAITTITPRETTTTVMKYRQWVV